MKLTIVKNVEFPRDVSEDFFPTWEAYLKMHAVTQLRVFENAERAVPECFRILVNQAGAKVPLQHTVNDFVQTASIVRRLKGFTTKGGVFGHMRLARHSQDISYSLAEPVCAAFNPTFVGVLVLRPQRFDMKYLIGRMQGLVYKIMPFQLDDKMPNGKPKRMRKLGALVAQDYWTAFEARDLKIQFARTDKELVLRYEVKPGGIVPMYKNLDATLKAHWRKSITGVFA